MPLGSRNEDRSDQEITYHVKLLHNASLIEIFDRSSLDGHQCYPTGLTWAGHEFLDATRKDTVWQKLKSTALEKTGGLSFEVLKQLATKLAVDIALGGHLPG